MAMDSHSLNPLSSMAGIRPFGFTASAGMSAMWSLPEASRNGQHTVKTAFLTRTGHTASHNIVARRIVLTYATSTTASISTVISGDYRWCP